MAFLSHLRGPYFILNFRMANDIDYINTLHLILSTNNLIIFRWKEGDQLKNWPLLLEKRSILYSAFLYTTSEIYSIFHDFCIHLISEALSKKKNFYFLVINKKDKRKFYGHLLFLAHFSLYMTYKNNILSGTVNTIYKDTKTFY